MRILPSLIAVIGLTCAGVFLPLAAADAPGGTPWPAPVAGWKAPESGEHPRLFFRTTDLPELRRRAETPDGKAIVQALRVLLDGKEGKTLPEIVLTAGQKPPEPKDLRPGMVLGLFHPAGYGMLHLLTGEQLRFLQHRPGRLVRARRNPPVVPEREMKDERRSFPTPAIRPARAITETQ